MAELRCSFCGKTTSVVAKMVAGSAANICNECVLLCVNLFEGDPTAWPTEDQLLVRFPDGTIHLCERAKGWTRLAHESAALEWTVASGLTSSTIVVVRRCGTRGPILGATVREHATPDEAEARAILEGHGGVTRFDEIASMAERTVLRVGRKPGAPDRASCSIRVGFLSERETANFLSHTTRVPTIDLEAYQVDGEILALVSREVCTKFVVLPVSRAGSSLIVAMTDPQDIAVLDHLKFVTGYNIEPVIAGPDAIRKAIARYYQ